MANQTVYKRVRDGFTEALTQAVYVKFGLEIDGAFDVVAQKVAYRPLTPGRLRFKKEELDFIAAFEEGYIAAAERAHAPLKVDLTSRLPQNPG